MYDFIASSKASIACESRLSQAGRECGYRSSMAASDTSPLKPSYCTFQMYLKPQRIIRHMENILLLFILFGGCFFLTVLKIICNSEHSVMVPLLCQCNLLSRLPCARHYATSFINIKSVPHRDLPSRIIFM